MKIKLNRLIPVGISMVVLAGGIVAIDKISTNFLSSRFSLQSESALSPEPSTAAAYSLQPDISLKEQVPLSFGGLVGGQVNTFIELTPDGHVFTSSEITGQSQRSHIGATNISRFSTNSLYKIHPGRLAFNVTALEENGKITVEYIANNLGEGVRFSNLALEVGPDTSTGLLRLPSTSINRVEFQAMHDISHGTVDLAFGGRLTISNSIKGKVDARLNLKASANNPEVNGYTGSNVFATVYQHVNFRGRSLILDTRKKYLISDLEKNIGNDIISSIKILTGHKLRACEHSRGGGTGRCEIFTSNQNDLRKIGFNDTISFLEIIDSH